MVMQLHVCEKTSRKREEHKWKGKQIFQNLNTK